MSDLTVNKDKYYRLLNSHANLVDAIRILESRIERAKALVGHKSLDSRRELLAILEGDDE